eukprot:GHRR01005475.1.p1 GENE.GHRR01005475.1~~GHRR01005475.1.p1  ORF type:complete len:190 (+),score=35.56 GHRR01005475.1:355-924(+)
MIVEVLQGYELRTGSTPGDLESFAALAREYNCWLGVDLDFQSFQQELAALPGCYAQPAGCILLASCKQQQQHANVGCVAIRPVILQGTHSSNSMHVAADKTGVHTPDEVRACEMKRLWVKEQHRGLGLGKVLAAAAIQKAKEMGYSVMVLDTLERLKSANVLYEQLGFVARTAYYHNPLPGVVYWQKQL